MITIVENPRRWIIGFAYFIVFIVIELLDLLLPYGSSVNDIFSLFVYYSLNFSFCALLLIYSLSFKHKLVYSLPDDCGGISRFFIVSSTVAFLLIFIDRIFIQGVDYSEGVSAAREMWREQALARSGVSSPLSVVGNLLFPFTYISIFLLVFNFELIRHSFYKITFSFFLVFIFALMVGGRAPLFVGVTFCYGAIVLRGFLGKSLFPKRMLFYMTLAGVIVLAYSAYIFSMRIEGSGIDISRYNDSLATRLLGVRTDNDSFINESLIAVMIYVAHVKWVFLNVIANESLFGFSVFDQLLFMLQKYLPFVDFGKVASVSWTYDTLWISLTGSLYHDFGLFGFFLYSALFFVLIFSMERYFTMRIPLGGRQSVYIMSLCCFFISILVISPFVFIFELVQYIYLFFLIISCFLFRTVVTTLRRLNR
jgi:hypothetical protein